MRYFLFLNFIIFASSAFECPSSKWLRFKNKCYLTDNNEYPFQAYVDFCRSNNATTVSIHSEEENLFFNTRLPKGDFWLPIRQLDDNQTFEWQNGNPFNYNGFFAPLLRKLEGRCDCAMIVHSLWICLPHCKNQRFGAFCQIDFDTPFYKLSSQISEVYQNLHQEMTTAEIRFNETNERLETELKLRDSLITNMSLTFEAKLMEINLKFDKSITELTMNLTRFITHLMSRNDLENRNAIRALDGRFDEINASLQNALSTLNALIRNLILNFQTDLENKEIQVNETLNELSPLTRVIQKSAS